MDDTNSNSTTITHTIAPKAIVPPTVFQKYQTIARATTTTRSFHIYHIKGQKVGSSCDLSRRLATQGLSINSPEVEILSIIPAHRENTLWDVWLSEQVEALKRGYKMETAGNLVTFLNAHALTRKRLMYSLTDLDGNHFEDVDHAGAWEKANAIPYGLLSNICNPDQAHKYVTLPSGKYTVSYQSSGSYQSSAGGKS
jgi:hypothetical protein